ncbi:glycoside hydrolase family 27 protein [Streptomyces sp. NPDC090075]|uniref:glycoside hydrolase family 27 protein n=1 Tax=Streptomyces sp. NPDC090075 TaxID=3365937 RepID=UPI00380A30CF
MRRQLRAVPAAFGVALLLSTGILTSDGRPERAHGNGVVLKPVLGWSSWSFVRRNPTARTVEAQAKALRDSGLAENGFVHVNVDDFWYECPGSQGPDVDKYGRWVTDPARFPAAGGENGIRVVADHVHSLGLKFGLYVTPGISRQAVERNTEIRGTRYHAQDIATATTEKNYNCGGMVGIDYTKPGAQAFIDSWAGQFARWGIDYLKIDGVGTRDEQDVQAWSDALRHTDRPIHLELSNSLDIDRAATWAELSDGWRTGGDIECYCGPDDSSYPLTTWAKVASRFDQVAAWAPYGGPGGHNDYDSLEIGNGEHTGLTPDERRTQMTLWSLAASPLVLGTDLTHLDPADLALLKNNDVLAVDQDGIDARRMSGDADSQVFVKAEPNGDVVVGLFNTDAAAREVATSAAVLGLPAAPEYALRDLWSHRLIRSSGRIAADVPPHGVVLYRVHGTDQVVGDAAPDVRPAPLS